jgi:hypothetical protein
LDKLFKKGKIKDGGQKQRFLAHLQPKIKKLCMVKNYANVEEMFVITKDVKKILDELGETPFEPFKEE